MGSKLTLTFSHLMSNKSGAVAIISAIAIPLLALLLFITMDTGRIYVVKSKVQESIDSALLAAVATKDLAKPGMTVDESLVAEFTQVFEANVKADYAGAEITNVLVTETVESSVYDASADVRVPLSYRWTAQADSQFHVTSQVTIDVASNNHSVEISMALDNTGSMAGTKITALKNAANNLVEIVFGSDATRENINISIIPYDTVVNIGPNHKDWMQATSQARYSSQTGFAANRRNDYMCAELYETIGGPYTRTQCYGASYTKITVANCTSGENPTLNYVARREGYYTTCGGGRDPETGVIKDTYPCYQEPSPEYWYCCATFNGVSDSYSGWYYNYKKYQYINNRYEYMCPNPDNALVDADDTPPNSGENWRFRTPYGEAAAKNVLNIPQYEYEYTTQLSSMLFASSEKSAIKSAINNMKISGATRINVGLMWAWFTLSPKWAGLWDGDPALPKPVGSSNEKILILMTDGKSYFSGDDLVTTKVCNAVKASGITLYTIGFGPQADINETLLRSCASEATKYFYAPTNEALENAFKQIAGNIIYPSLRISK